MTVEGNNLEHMNLITFLLIVSAFKVMSEQVASLKRRKRLPGFGLVKSPKN